MLSNKLETINDKKHVRKQNWLQNVSTLYRRLTTWISMQYDKFDNRGIRKPVINKNGVSNNLIIKLQQTAL